MRTDEVNRQSIWLLVMPLICGDIQPSSLVEQTSQSKGVRGFAAAYILKRDQ